MSDNDTVQRLAVGSPSDKQRTKRRVEPRKLDLAFASSGFMGTYYFGVSDCLRKYIPRERVNRVSGTSAGSLQAAYYLLQLDLGESLNEIVELFEGIRNRPLGVFDRKHQIVDMLPRILDRLFPADAHKQVADRLYVCMTRLKDMSKVIVNEFESKQELIDALNCSCYIPGWSGNRVPKYKGVKHIDGGFNDNLPVFDKHTVRISPFSGATDISPYCKLKLMPTTIFQLPIYMSFRNCKRAKLALWPPLPSQLLRIIETGFHDSCQFVLDNDLIQCDACYHTTDPRDQPIYSRPSPCISPAASRAGSPSVSRSSSQCHLAPGEADSLAVPAGGESRARTPSFSSQLRSKLHNFSAARANTAAPQILVDAPDAPPAKRPPAGEAGGDKFTRAPALLPSCPPSPTLNRHCNECLRMRQAARADVLCDEIRKVALRYSKHKEPLDAGLRDKLRNPLGWIKQLAARNSYEFECIEPQSLVAHH